MARRRRIKGEFAVRRLLRRLPDQARDKMAQALEHGGAKLAAEMRGDAPVRTGAFRNALRYKVLRRSLQLRVGVIGKALNRQLYYRWVIERGRKAQTVTIKKGPRAGSIMHVSALPPREVVLKRRRNLMAEMNQELRDYWPQVLEQAAQGLNFDE